jgi:hypothetical protein
MSPGALREVDVTSAAFSPADNMVRTRIQCQGFGTEAAIVLTSSVAEERKP